MGRRSCSFASSASRASLNWFLRRLLISTSKRFRRPTIGPCVYSHGRAPSPTPRSRGGGISYARVLPPCLANRCLRAVLFSPYAPFGRTSIFQVPYGREVLHDPLKVGLPVLLFLRAGYHGLWRAYAVTSGIPAHHRLAFLGCRSSFGQTQTIRTTRRTHAAPPLIRICSIASSPARSQLLSAARRATGSFANPASCICSSHSSWAERSTVSFSWAESSA